MITKRLFPVLIAFTLLLPLSGCGYTAVNCGQREASTASTAVRLQSGSAADPRPGSVSW